MADETYSVGLKFETTGASDLLRTAQDIQKVFSRLKLPPRLTAGFESSMVNLEKHALKFQNLLDSGGSSKSLQKEGNTILREWERIEGYLRQVKAMTGKDLLKFDTKDIKAVEAEIENLQKQIQNTFKADVNSEFTNKIKAGVEGLRSVLDNTGSKWKGKAPGGLLDQLIGNVNSGDIEKVKTNIAELEQYINRVTNLDGTKKGGRFNEKISQSVLNEFNQIKSGLHDGEASIEEYTGKIEQLEVKLATLKAGEITKLADTTSKLGDSARRAGDGFEQYSRSAVIARGQTERLNRDLDSIRSRVENFFGLNRVFDIARRVARQAFQTVEALDKSMTQTAVVTNFRVGDMWEKLPEYTKTANQLGSTIKDVYDASTLYYQQGLGTQATMELSVETLKMARIAGMDAAKATDMMTAALRGFNMELNQTDAQRVNDVYSKLAAITAANTQEISTAMTKVASLAHSAGMEFETTSAFLSQIIETTREAPETAGTALKTVVARFGEIKQLMSTDQLIGQDEEGETIFVNKIDKALGAAGLSLKKFAAGQEGLDDVLLRLAEKWDTLDTATQRYIATMAAGSRQQSRFLALMSDYDRTIELVDAAYNSNGASQKQYEKTLESLESMMNKLKNAGNEFVMGFLNNKIIKESIDSLTNLVTVINKVIDAISKIAPKNLEGLTKSLITAGAAWTTFTKVGPLATGAITNVGAMLLGKNTYRTAAGEEVQRQTIRGVFDQSAQKVRGGKVGFNDTSVIKGMNYGTTMMPPTMFTGFGQLGNISLANNIQAVQSNMIKTAVDQKYQGIVGELEAAITQLEASPSVEEQAQARERISVAKERLATELGTEAVQMIDELTKSATIEGSSVWFTQGMKNPAAHQEKKGQTFDAIYGELGKKVQDSQSTFQNAAMSVQMFGGALQMVGSTVSQLNPLLKPLGAAISFIGTVMTTVGSAMWSIQQLTKLITVETLAEAAAHVVNSAAIVAETVATQGLAAAKAVLEKDVFFKGSLAIILAVTAAIIGVIAAVDALTVSLGEAEDRAAAGAAAAQEAANNANSAYEEMSNALTHIKENGDAFDDLVAGSAKWEEQLVKNNQEILDLIKNYSELQQYVTTRGDGRLVLSSEGQEKAHDLASDNVKRSTAIQTLQNLEQQRLEFDRKIQKEQNASQRELLKRQKESVTRMSAETAFRQLSQTSGLDLKNREVIANYGASRYGSPEYVQNLRLGKAEEQEVLDFYGYTRVGKNKYQDNTGKEISIDKEAMKSLYATIQQADVFQANAQQWDDIITELNSTFQNVALKQKGLQDTKGLGQAFSKILTQNGVVDGDLLKQVATNRTIVDDFVTGIEQSQRDFIAGHDNATVAEVRQILQENAEAMRQLDLDRTTDIASMMTAYSSQASQTANEATKEVFDKNYKIVDKLSAEQRKSLADNLEKIGDSQWGEGGAIYANFAVQAEQLGGKTAVAFNEAFGADFDPTSAISSARAVSLLQNSGTKLGKQAGKALETALGDQIGLAAQTKEVLASGDYNDAVNELMKDLGDGAALSSADINKLAGSSQTLRRYLDQTNMSLSTFANIANSGDFSKLNDAVLTLAQNFGKVDAIAEQAHSTIENFSAGIDTGEADDFMKDNAGKALDYIKGGEWGNQELQSILSQTFSDYQKIFKQYHGNLEKVGKYYKGRIKDLSVDEDSIPKYLATRTKKLDKLLKGTGAEYTTKSGLLEITKIGKLTTDQLQNILRKAGNLTPQMAEVVMESMLNRSGTLGRDLKRNDYSQSFETYRKERSIGGQAFITGTTAGMVAPMAGKSKQTVIKDATKAQLQYIETRKDVQSEKYQQFGTPGLVNALNQIASKFSGTESNNIGKNLQTIAKSVGAQEKAGINAPKMMQALGKVGFNQDQQLRSMQQVLQSGKQLTDDRGRVLKGLDSNSTTQEIAEAIAKANENQKWYDIGQQIAEGYVDYLGNNGSNDNDDSPGIIERTFTSTKTVIKRVKERYGPHGDGKTGTVILNASKAILNTDEMTGNTTLGGLPNYNNFIDRWNKNLPTNAFGRFDTSTVKVNTDIPNPLRGIYGKARGSYDNYNINTDVLRGTTSGAPIPDNYFENYMKNFKVSPPEVGSFKEAVHNKLQEYMDSAFEKKGSEDLTSVVENKIKGLVESIVNLPDTIENALEKFFKPIDNLPAITQKWLKDFRNKLLKVKIPSITNIIKQILSKIKPTQINVTDILKSLFGPNPIIQDEDPYNIKTPPSLPSDTPSPEPGMKGQEVNRTGIKSGEKSGKESTKTIKGQNVTNKVKTQVDDSALKDTDKKLAKLKNSKNTVKVKADTGQANNQLKQLDNNVKKKREVKVQATGDKVVKNLIKLAQKLTTETKKKRKVAVGTSGEGKLTNLKRLMGSITNKTVKISADATNITNTIANVASSISDLIRDAGKVKIGKRAVGQNNAYPSTHLPTIGSAAEGTAQDREEERKRRREELKEQRLYGSAAKGRQGRVGPRGTGGATLVGEEGPELAWLPSQSRSVLLGANGPQVVNLPKDAVIYTNTQTKNIFGDKKVKKIGSAASGFNKKKHIAKNNVKDYKTSYKQKEAAIEVKISQIELQQASNNRYTAQAVLTKQLNSIKLLLEAELEVAKKNVDKLGNIATASHTVNVKRKNKKGKDTSIKVDTKSLIGKDASGGYVLDAKYITKKVESYYDSLIKKDVKPKDAQKYAKEFQKNLEEAGQKRIDEYSEAVNKQKSVQEQLTSIQEQIYALGDMRNEYGKIWSLQQKIASYENKRNLLAKQYSTMLSEQVFGHEELFSLIKQQQDTYANVVRDQNAIMAATRLDIEDILTTKISDTQNLGDFIDQKALWADPQNMVVQTLDKLTDMVEGGDLTPDQYNRITTEIGRLESSASNWNAAVNSIADARDSLRELLQTGRQESITLEGQILEAIKSIRQETIDNLSTLNDTINKTLSDLTTQVTQRLDKIRQQNENAKTEQSLLDKQQRLAMLQMDTGNGNAVEIAALQKEIAEDQQGYLESLQDQTLQNIQNQNEEASNQREKQIDLLTKQLDYQEKTGKLAAETNAMMQMVSTIEGQNAIQDLLTSAEHRLANPYYANQQWFEELVTNLNQSQVYKDIQDMKTLLENSTYTLKDWLNYILKEGGDITPSQLEQIHQAGGDFTASDKPTTDVIKEKYNKALANAAAGNASSEDWDILKQESKTNFSGVAQDLKSKGVSAQDIQKGLGATDRQMVAAQYNGGHVFDTSELKKFIAPDVLTSGGKAGGERDASELGFAVGSQFNAGGSNKYNGAAITVQKKYDDGTVLAVNGTSQGLVNLYRIPKKQIKEGMNSATLGKYKTKVLNPTNAADAKTIGKYMATAIKNKHESVAREYANGIRTALELGHKVDLKSVISGMGGSNQNAADLQRLMTGSQQKGITIKKAPGGTDGRSIIGTVGAHVGTDGKLYYNDNATGAMGAIQVMNPTTWKQAEKAHGIAGKTFADWVGSKAKWTQKAIYYEVGNIVNKNANAAKNKNVQKIYNEDWFKKLPKYATGGLNQDTGLAMLHGTPSKPELVLNAKDTQNFLQLKDVLSHAMSGATTTNNSALTQYEININVDKIANDYDVERMTDQVIRKITQAGGYKKVTRGTFR